VENITSQVQSKKALSFFKMYKTFIFIIIIATILGGVIGGLIGKVKDKTKYTASCNLMVKITLGHETVVPQEKDLLAAIQVTQKYFKTITDMYVKPVVVERAKELKNQNGEVDKGISASSISVNVEDNSFIFKVSYTDTKKDMAIERLDKVINAAEDVINEKEKGEFKGYNIHCVKTQNDYSVGMSNRLRIFILVGGLIAFALSLVVSVFVNLLDRRIKDSEELEAITGTSILASIEKTKNR